MDCIKCKRLIRNDAAFCPFCGQVYIQHEKDSAVEAINVESMIERLVEEDSEAVIEDNKNEDNLQGENRKSTKGKANWKLVMLVAAPVLLVLCIVIFWGMNSKLSSVKRELKQVEENNRVLQDTAEQLQKEMDQLSSDYLDLEDDYLGLCNEYTDAIEEYVSVSDSLEEQKEKISTLQNQLSTANSDKKKYKDAADFLYGYIAIVPEGSSTYHSYKCTNYDKKASFYAFNKPTAILQGYKACSYCSKYFE